MSSVANTQIQWGPYILMALGAMGIVAWYTIRRFISRLDELGVSLAGLTTDVAVLKDRQKLTATKVGVPASKLQDPDAE